MSEQNPSGRYTELQCGLCEFASGGDPVHETQRITAEFDAHMATHGVTKEDLLALKGVFISSLDGAQWFSNSYAYLDAEGKTLVRKVAGGRRETDDPMYLSDEQLEDLRKAREEKQAKARAARAKRKEKE